MSSIDYSLSQDDNSQYTSAFTSATTPPTTSTAITTALSILFEALEVPWALGSSTASKVACVGADWRLGLKPTSQ